MTDKLYDPTQIQARLQTQLPHWVLNQGCLERHYRCNGWRASVLLFNAVAHLAEAAWHHPDVEVSWGGIRVRLQTHSTNGITDKDFELAAQIEALATWRPGPDSALDGTPDDDRWRYRDPD